MVNSSAETLHRAATPVAKPHSVLYFRGMPKNRENTSSDLKFQSNIKEPKIEIKK